MVRTDYNGLMELWAKVDLGSQKHVCTVGEYMDCPVCVTSIEAKGEVWDHISEVMKLLVKYHDQLEALTAAVAQEVDFPRPDKLQHALLLAVALLNKS